MLLRINLILFIQSAPVASTLGDVYFETLEFLCFFSEVSEVEVA